MGSDADAAVVAVAGSVRGWWGLGVCLAGSHDPCGFASGHLVLLVDEVGDAVAEGVGGVLDGERAEPCGLGELLFEFGPVPGEVRQECSERRQGGIAGAGGRGSGDLGEPFADPGLAGFEGTVEAALRIMLGPGVLRCAGGTQVGVGGLVGGAPLLDVWSDWLSTDS